MTRAPKRPRGPNQLAKMLVDIATVAVTDSELPQRQIREMMARTLRP